MAKIFILTITSILTANPSVNTPKYTIDMDSLNTECFGGLSLIIEPIPISNLNKKFVQDHKENSSLMNIFDSLSKIHIKISYEENNHSYFM
ncbi:hypothetical protein COBT_001954 [Conglomerata obtusa]